MFIALKISRYGVDSCFDGNLELENNNNIFGGYVGYFVGVYTIAYI